MTKCVVEGCGEEYDVTCSFSFYNVNTTSDSDALRQNWIEGALQEDSECLWRHVSLQLCAYHFESDQQGLWIESPVLPELLTVHSEPDLSKNEDVIKLEHNYSAGVPRCAAGDEGASRLNVRQLVDTLGYLSLKNLQRKQLWVVNVEGAGAEASVTQTEQVITKMSDPKQIIEIIPPTSGEHGATLAGSEVLEVMEETTIPDNFIYEIAEEQEVSPEEVREIPYVRPNKDWTVSVVSEQARPKYAFIRHGAPARRRRPLRPAPPDLYILPDADPSVGVEVTTSYDDGFGVDGYEHLVLQDERPPTAVELEPWEVETPRRRRKKQPATSAKRIKQELDWGDAADAADAGDDDDTERRNNRVRRKNKKYVGYDFVT